MITPFYLSSEPLQRNEQRFLLRHFVEVKVVDEEISERIDAMTTDISDTGLGLLSAMPLPVGSQVEINANGRCMAIGKVVNSYEWGNYDLFRVGILITEQNEYWAILPCA